MVEGDSSSTMVALQGKRRSDAFPLPYRGGYEENPLFAFAAYPPVMYLTRKRGAFPPRS
jgi:hypothetical protein